MADSWLWVIRIILALILLWSVTAAMVLASPEGTELERVD